MVERIAATLLILVLACIALWASNRWQEDKRPLLISSGCTAGPNPCLRMKCEPKPNTRSVA